MNLINYLGDWNKLINLQKLNAILKSLTPLIEKDLLCPKSYDVFKAFNLCSLKDLRVVFLGQDPYPQKGVATGVLFGNRKEIEENNLSPSLKIIKDAAINFEVPHNSIIFDQTLESWAEQGILMINSALTCEVNKIGSHSDLWRPFIGDLLNKIVEYDRSVIFVLFGRVAQCFIPYIKNAKYIIQVEHPAYFARTNRRMPISTFKEINKLVNNLYGNKIKWYQEE